jgi:spermidine/putrescine transport system substrate-binding protein
MRGLRPALTGPVSASAPLLRGALTRRTLLRGAGGAALASALAACGTSGTSRSTSTAAQRAAPDRSEAERRVTWSNWPEYLDVGAAGRSHPTLDEFRRRTGISVDYTEDVNDNDEFFAKVRPQLSAGTDPGRDTFVVTDWMVARLIRLGWVQPLDRANLPHAVNLEPALVNAASDPGRRYSLPWQTGFAAMAYNPRATGGRPVESVDQLLTDPTLKGRVTLLTEMRDTVGLVLLALGKDPATFSDADFDAAIGEISRARSAGQLRGFTGNDYTRPLASGETAACFAWAGDVVQLQADVPDLRYVLPRAGYLLYSDDFVIPNQARHKRNAERLIDYYYDPEVMAQVEDDVNYISPVRGAQQVLAARDPAVANNPLIFPSPVVLADAHVFRTLSEDEETRYNQKFQALIGA